MKKGEKITLEQLHEDLAFLNSNPFDDFIELKEKFAQKKSNTMTDNQYICENCFMKEHVVVRRSEHGKSRQHGISQCQKCRCYSFIDPTKELEHIAAKLAELVKERKHYESMQAALESALLEDKPCQHSEISCPGWKSSDST